ncbi:DUF4352 domain-containing protein [Streptomyces sp. Amel2xC10]|uniref:DUF4352 domain-containing protein n=1 Tax=Streptomyces sp. Amel2xC10 TaxID=1305826 RepID=UPI00117E9C1D|nr:DUF4352 domain-containing protein [Streptomyces sp. Amel2xC10]
MSACRNLGRAAAAFALVVIMAACSDSSDRSPGADSSGTTGGTTTTGGSTRAGVPPGAEVLGTTRPGKPFTVTVLASDTTNDPHRWQFTVRSVACGQPLDHAVLAYAADAVGSPTASPTPEAGKQFCVLTMDAINVGKSMASWDASNKVSLNVVDTRYTESQSDADYALDYAQYWNSRGQTAPTFGINPGSKGPVHGVFQIPAGEKPTSLWVTAGTAITTFDGVQPGYLVHLT